MDALRLTVEQIDGVSVARLEGEIDKLAVDEARERLVPLAEAGRLVVDLGKVSFIDSAGLHALFGLGRVAGDNGGRVALCVPPACPVARAISIVHLADVVPVYEAVGEAVGSLGDVSDAVPTGKDVGITRGAQRYDQAKRLEVDGT
jgi:anti-anti-sigma factor